MEYILLKPFWILSRKLISTFFDSSSLKASLGVVSLQLLRRCLSSIRHARLVAPPNTLLSKLIDKHLAVDVFRSDSFGELVLTVICVTPLSNLCQGLMFCIGVPMGWSTLNTTNHLPYDVLAPVYIGGCFWVWTYETIYQHMVRKNLYLKSKELTNLF